ncbi:MAG: hypothetical protein JSS09_09675, partial [Verrucomicrobia bacterium]|nr:hypothetical protein [Verrucomicrobiota bacterium]
HEIQNKTTLTSDFYIKLWAETRSKDLLYKTTLLGPHRDDIFFSIKGQDVKSYCSEGQKRCCLTALRLAEWEILKKRLGHPPLFGIDDFGVHLDNKRSSLLEDLLQDMGQIFLTAPSFTSKEKAHFLYAEDGSLTFSPTYSNQKKT